MMKLLGIRKSSADEGSFDTARFRIGSQTDLLMTQAHVPMLFSSRAKALAFITRNGMRGLEVYKPAMMLGSFLGALASADHCTEFVVNCRQRIAAFSCSSAGYVLPSHFYRFSSGRFQALWHDDRWHNAEPEEECLRCGCGSELAPYQLCILSSQRLKRIPALYQLHAGSVTTHDGSTCVSMLFIDLEPPESHLVLQVILRADGDERVLRYDLSPDGFRELDEEADTGYAQCDPGTDGAEPWNLCPLSDLARIGAPAISSSSGLESVELRATLGTGLKGRCRTVSTGKMKNIPVRQYEFLPVEAKQVLEELRTQPTLPST